VVNNYVPEKGDIVWLDFTVQLGHEQRGTRPAIVLSKKAYNQKVGLALFCPITSKEKGYPFEVKIIGENISSCGSIDSSKQIHLTSYNKNYKRHCTKN
jgi:mRNA interferase MazF